ncbi:MAG: methyltransferase domain-containing protein [Clostridiales bacterium]|nr:methyltransferase domain-containing protein [Clostridiales bacterium]
MNQNYSILAGYYDKFTHKDCDYERWSQYLYNIAKKHTVCEIVDIACGTGKMTKRLSDLGLRAIGIDRSIDMLNVAQTKCKAKFVQQDMTKLQLAHAVDMAICINDGVNYLKPSELVPFFKRVAANVKQGAPFVFDVSSEYKLTQIVGSNVFFWDDEGETLLWSNSFKGDTVEMNLTLFVDDGNGRYVRHDERHLQYIHTVSYVQSALDNAGFEVIEVSSDYGEPLSATSQRISFYATKK